VGEKFPIFGCAAPEAVADGLKATLAAVHTREK
jgi:hypothetical protein